MLRSIQRDPDMVVRLATREVARQAGTSPASAWRAIKKLEATRMILSDGSIATGRREYFLPMEMLG